MGKKITIPTSIPGGKKWKLFISSFMSASYLNFPLGNGAGSLDRVRAAVTKLDHGVPGHELKGAQVAQSVGDGRVAKGRLGHQHEALELGTGLLTNVLKGITWFKALTSIVSVSYTHLTLPTTPYV